MGNQNRANNREIQFESEHPHLSQCKIVTSEQRTLLKYTTCLDRKEYVKWKEALELYNEQSKLFLPIEHHFSTTTLCGNAGTIEAIFPHYPHLLHTEIYSRLNNKTDFNEQELWHLLFALTAAKKQAMDSGQMLGDIRPKNIMLNQQGLIKVPTLHSWPNEINRYQKTLANIPAYLAPEQIQLLEGVVDSSNLTESSEMFSIGLTLLSTANLTDYETLYNYENFTFDYTLFEQALYELILNNYYSQVLRSTIKNLCSIQPKKRMTLHQVWNMLAKNEQAITIRTNFVISNAPEKLHQEVQLLRNIFSQKNAQFPSNLPDRTNQSMYSEREGSVFERLVPSHLDENTSSALRWSG